MGAISHIKWITILAGNSINNTHSHTDWKDFQESPNGSLKVFTVQSGDENWNNILVHYNGQIQFDEDITEDAGSGTITFGSAPLASAKIQYKVEKNA